MLRQLRFSSLFNLDITSFSSTIIPRGCGLYLRKIQQLQALQVYNQHDEALDQINAAPRPIDSTPLLCALLVII
jgi:hypothetical protein